MRAKASKRIALPQSRKRKPDDPEQFERFVEAARKAGVNENSDALDRAFDKIVGQPSKMGKS